MSNMGKEHMIRRLLDCRAPAGRVLVRLGQPSPARGTAERGGLNRASFVPEPYFDSGLQGDPDELLSSIQDPLRFVSDRGFRRLFGRLNLAVGDLR